MTFCFNSKFNDLISDIYPREQTTSETTRVYFSCFLCRLSIKDENNSITKKLYDNRDAFGFHTVNFPPLCKAIFSLHQLLVSMHVSSFAMPVVAQIIVTRLLSQGYKANRLANTFKRLCSRHTDLVGQYKENVCQMFADSLS